MPNPAPPKTPSYRKIAFDKYPPICAYCGFGIKGILQVAHLNHNRKDGFPENLVILYPTCHKMYDGNLTHKDSPMNNTPKHPADIIMVVLFTLVMVGSFVWGCLIAGYGLMVGHP